METIAICVTAIVALVMICSTALAIARKVVEGRLHRALVENVDRESVHEICAYALRGVIEDGERD